MTTIIHVNRNAITMNEKTGRNAPVIRIETEDGMFTVAYGCEIDGPSRVVYSPGLPKPCGATVWIEAEGEVRPIFATGDVDGR